MPRRMQWRSVKTPKPIDLTLKDLDVDRPEIHLTRRDRLQLSSGTTRRAEYERLVAMLRDLHRRVTMLPLLRALRDQRVTLGELDRAYQSGPGALAHLLANTTAERLSDHIAPYEREHAHVKELPERMRRVRAFIAWLGADERVSRFTAKQVNAFLAALAVRRRGALKSAAKERPSAQTINNYRASLSAFAAWLVAQGVLAKHPIEHKAVKRVKRVESPRLRPLTAAEFRDYLEAAGRVREDARVALQLILHTGADRGEIVGNKAEKLAPLAAEQVWFDHGANGETVVMLQRTKTGRQALVPVPESFVPALRAQIAATNAKGVDPVFPGMSPFQLLVAHRAGRAAIGRPTLTFKGLRHLAAIQWVRSGVPIRVVSQWLRHSSLSQTMVYTEYELEAEERRQMADKAAEAWLEEQDVVRITQRRQHG